MEELQLRPCPFCGTDSSDGFKASDSHQRYIGCCACSLGCVKDTQVNRETWNTRPLEDALRTELEQVKTERDVATEVVENIQGKVAMYAGKYEMEKKAREKAEKTARVLAEQLGKGNLAKINDCLEWAEKEAAKREGGGE